jgi:hypothetical protein
MTLSLDWPLPDGLFGLGNVIAETITRIVKEQCADLAELFPLKGSYELLGHIDDDCLIFKITERHGSSMPLVSGLKADELDFVKSKVLPFKPRTHSEIFALLGPDWFAFDKFTYVGPYRDSYACWPDFIQNLIDWLNHLVLPEVLSRNETRILRAIPRPPQFNIEAIRKACWVLECDEILAQGTAFYLEGIGLVSCQHVLGPTTVAFSPDNISKKYPVTVVAQDKTIDCSCAG